MTDAWPGTPEDDAWPGTLEAPHADVRAPGAGETAVVPDVAKSFGAGVVRGAAAIPGIPGSHAEFLANNAPQWIQDAAASVRHWIAHHVGMTPEALDQGLIDLNKRYSLPTTGDTIGAVERNVTGPLYQAKTSPGRYAETVGEFVPAALAGPEGIGGNLIKGAIVPGLTSEAASDLAKGTGYEPAARLAGGLAGGVGAQAAHTGLNSVRTGAAAGSAARQAEQLTGNPDITGHAIRLMSKDVTNEGLTPAIAQQRMSELGPEGMMLDTGRQQLSRAQGVATEMGPGQTRLLNAVEGRTGDFGEATAQRIKGTLNATMGRSPDVVAMRDAVARVVDSQAKPLYDSVMNAHPIVDVPSEIASRPAIAAAMRDAPEVARNYGEKLSQPVTRTTLNAAGVPVTETVQQAAQPSLRYWDYVKKVLDKRIKGYYTGSDLSSADKADLGGLQVARRALVDHLDATTGGAYADARRVAAAKPQLTEALQDGRDALNTKLLPEELKEIHDNMSIPEQGMLRAGMRREVERIIDTARNDGAAARRILDTNQNREKIAAIFGQRAADAIDQRIGAETKFQKATHKVVESSETEFRRSAKKDTESPSISDPPSATMLGYAMKGVNALRQQRANLGTERTRAAVAALSTAPAAQVPDLVRILAGYNQRAAANARPPIAPTANTLARVLAANAPGRQEDQAAGRTFR
jgi:hypothetical protein